ncbi:hypothetical protein GCM10011387_16570 [Pedobacter quisquiliarum]|uniref:Uncharacterized protein n=1 Tax=Pedobacter quisquiliarum TaxID=1834438 RepID=A0A916U8Q6_9SPHI|nr:hypothetical protein [Pedobacter quisquiliarum]GGC63624.1 hypothetical protein GCM10011387_16570 [Pedobacter quisquiliarum]
MKKFLILVITIVAMISCSKDGSDNPSGLKIRLSNSSQYNFKDIVINTTTGDVNFGNLNSGQKTEYKEFNKAYRYAFVKLEIDGKTYTIQPIDYVGETTLKNGSYTYQIDVNNTQDQYTNLNLTLIEE